MMSVPAGQQHQLLPLYGGALSVAVPGKWIDASNIQPIPDNQEVWQLASDDGPPQTLIIELNERDASTKDEVLAVSYFNDMHEDASAVSQEALSDSIVTLSGALAPVLATVPGSSGQSIFAQLPNGERAYLGVLRLGDVISTDVAIAVYTFAESSGDSPPPHVLQQAQYVLDACLASFTVNDAGLFGGGGGGV